MKVLKKLFLIILFLIPNTLKAENYVFGGVKIFDYGIESSDLQTLNTSLVNLGFTSSFSETDNIGVGFDLGVGIGIANNLSLEAGYVDYGTLEINTRTTGPVERIKTEITGNGFTLAGKLSNLGDSGIFVKGGMHAWDLSGKISTSLGSSSEALGDGTDPFFSIGYMSPGSNTGWNFAYDHYVIDDGDIGSLTFGYSEVF